MLLKKIFRKGLLGASLSLLPIANISMAERFEPIGLRNLNAICDSVIKTFFYASKKYAREIIYHCGWGGNFLSENLTLNLETVLFMVDCIGEACLSSPYCPKEQKIEELKEIIRRVYTELPTLYKEEERLDEEEKSLKKEGKDSEAKKKGKAAQAKYSEYNAKARRLEKDAEEFVKTLSRMKPKPDSDVRDKDRDIRPILKHIELLYYIQLIIGKKKKHFNDFADRFCNYARQESDKRSYPFEEDVLKLISKDVPHCLMSLDKDWSAKSRTRFIDIMKYFRERYKYLDQDILKDPIWYSLFHFLECTNFSNCAGIERTFLTETSTLVVQYPLNTMNPHDYREWCLNVAAQMGWANQDRLRSLFNYIEAETYTPKKWDIIKQFIGSLINFTENLTSFAQNDFSWLYEEMSRCIDHHTNDGGIVFFDDSEYNQKYYTTLCSVKTIFDQISKEAPTILAFIISLVQNLDEETATKLTYALLEQNHLNLEDGVQTVQNQVRTITRDLESEEKEGADAEETNLEPKGLYVCHPLYYSNTQEIIQEKIENNPYVKCLEQKINEIDKKLINIKNSNEKEALEMKKESLRETLKTIEYCLMADEIELYGTLPTVI